MQNPILVLALALLAAPAASAWGVLGHQLVATTALKDLPPALAPWFQGQEATLSAHASDPDHWREHDPREAPRHYLDCEAYGGADRIPLDEDAARTLLGPGPFLQAGELPWTVLARVQELARAFTRGDSGQVACHAATLSHYVGDLHVPLHTTVNHDGDATGQHGIHHRWEVGLLERLVDREGWVPEVRPAPSLAEPQAAPWTWLRETNEHVQAVLRSDFSATSSIEQASAHAPAPAAPALLDQAYWQIFLQLQGPLVKEQLDRAAVATAQMISYAWEQAGRPPAPQASR